MDVDFRGGVYGINLDYVPLTRKINNKTLDSDITLTASDVGARSSTWMPTASDVGALPISGGGTVTGHIYTTNTGESNVGCNFKGGILYLFGNNSTGNHGLYDSVKGYIINLNGTTPQFNGNATSATTATSATNATNANYATSAGTAADNGAWTLLSSTSVSSSVTFTDSHNCSAYIVWIYQSAGYWISCVHLASNMGYKLGYYSNSSYWEHTLSKSGNTLTLTNNNTVAETYMVYGIR